MKKVIVLLAASLLLTGYMSFSNVSSNVFDSSISPPAPTPTVVLIPRYPATATPMSPQKIGPKYRPTFPKGL